MSNGKQPDVQRGAGSSAPPLLQPDSVYQPAMTEQIPQRTRRSPTVSLGLLGGALFGVMGPFVVTLGLQSSLNAKAGVGVASGAICYAAACLSTVLVYLLFQVFQWRLWLAIGLCTHILYVLLNMYPAWFTLVPAAVLAGITSGMCLRLVNKATDLYTYEQQLRTGLAREVIRKQYNTWLFVLEWLGIVLCAALAGSILKQQSSCYLRPVSINRLATRTAPATPLPSSLSNSSTLTTAPATEPLGFYNVSVWINQTATTLTAKTTSVIESNTAPSKLSIALLCGNRGCPQQYPCWEMKRNSQYGLLGLYAFLGVVAVVLMLLFMEQPASHLPALAGRPLSDTLPPDTPAATPTVEDKRDISVAPAENSHDNSTLPLTDGDDVSQLGEKVREHPRERATRRARELLLVLRDPRLFCLAPLWFAFGNITGLYLADVTRFYNACALDVSHVGFSLACLALVQLVVRVLCDYVCGGMQQRAPPRLALVVLGALLHLVLLVVLLAWDGTGHPLPAVYCVACLWGLASGLLQAQMDGLEHEIAPEHQEKVSVLLRVARQLGLMLAFALSAGACMLVKASISLVLLVAGVTLFVCTIVRLIKNVKKNAQTESLHM